MAASMYTEVTNYQFTPFCWSYRISLSNIFSQYPEICGIEKSLQTLLSSDLFLLLENQGDLYVRVAKTPADKVSFPLTEVVITPSAPLSIVVYFYPAVWRVSSSRQPELNILDTPCINKCLNKDLFYFNTTKGIPVSLFVSLYLIMLWCTQRVNRIKMNP